ncbi:MAG: DUF4026 domain-containing protein [Phycisphaeraceae bacterium]|nr:DUF4026 domain-containing protein [Phycisphaeraceae bacterium]
MAAGTVLYRGNLAPRAEDFGSLRTRDIDITPMDAGPDWRWRTRWRHPEWGEAVVGVMRASAKPPEELFEFSNSLTEGERREALAGEVGIVIHVEGAKSDVLKDRKRLLWFLREAMGREGVVAMDHLSTLMWSPAALDDELAHEADLDIDGVYCIHAVYKEDPNDTSWMHSHGLAELGAFDFDILRPSDDLRGGGQDVLRAVAFAIVEGSLTPGSPSFRVAHPGGGIRPVDASKFMASASAEDRALRDDDGSHLPKRVVLCDPRRGLARFRRDAPRPSRFLSSPIAQQTAIHFSQSATELMGARARATVRMLARAMEEFAEFEVDAIAKLGYETDSGGGHEHMWFSVHGVSDDGLDATLESKPFNNAAMRPGQRSMHDLARLSDWMIFTPAGPITPRSGMAGRNIRENIDKLREMTRLGAGDEPEP